MYLYAVMAEKPGPAAVVKILREISKVDRTLLKNSGFDDVAIDQLEKKIAAFIAPPQGKQRKIDEAGLLNLYDAFCKRLTPGNFALWKQESKRSF